MNILFQKKVYFLINESSLKTKKFLININNPLTNFIQNVIIFEF